MGRGGIGWLRHGHRRRQPRAGRRRAGMGGAHLARCTDGHRPRRLPRAHGSRDRRHLAGAARELGQPHRGRDHGARRPTRSVVLGDALCLRVAGVPGPQAWPGERTVSVLLALDVPPINHLIRWPAFWFADNKYFAVNKVVLLMWIAVILVLAFYFSAARKRQLVPSGVQGLAESAVDFIRDGVILQTM